MGEIMRMLKQTWLWTLEPPWWSSGSEKERSAHWFVWVLGWVWAIGGIAIGALYAPLLIEAVGLSGSSYRDILLIVIAVFAGFILHLFGWFIEILMESQARRQGVEKIAGNEGLTSVFFIVIFGFPLLVMLLALSFYLNVASAGKQSVTVGFVGALLVKTFLFPLIKGIVTGAIFMWFKNWLRGGKAKARGA
jgi:hypothetical protein